jgi:hypothetical protein
MKSVKEIINYVLNDDLSLFPLLIYNFQTVKITNSFIHPVESPYLRKHTEGQCKCVIHKIYDIFFNP